LEEHSSFCGATTKWKTARERFVCTKDYKSDFDGVYGPILDRVLPSDWRVGYGTRHKPVCWSIFEPGGFLVEPLLSNLKVVVKVGKTLLVHDGGLDSEHLTDNDGIKGLNQAAPNWNSKTGIPDPPFLAILGRAGTIRMKEPYWLATNE
jgi:hypothetical protein